MAATDFFREDDWIREYLTCWPIWMIAFGGFLFWLPLYIYHMRQATKLSNLMHEKQDAWNKAHTSCRARLAAGTNKQ